jgi:hypothetical protein
VGHDLQLVGGRAFIIVGTWANRFFFMQNLTSDFAED